MSIKILIAAHGKIAEEITNSTKDIVGENDDIMFFNIERDNSAEKIRKEFDDLVSRLVEKNEILIITDIIGGTPSNMASPHLKNKKIGLITGVNLAMAIAAVQKKKNILDLKVLADAVCETARKSIVNYRDNL